MRIGIDLGGTKISIIALDRAGATLFASRTATPRNDYEGTIEAIRQLVHTAETTTGRKGTLGIGMPGSLAPRSRLVQNANSTWLNDRPFGDDLQQALGREVRLANDANCFTLSEAIDGAAKGCTNVFGVILGTGCGGGLVVERKLVNGPLNITGEWGHVPLPWMETNEFPGPLCWCGARGCMETFVSGPALSRDHHQHTGEDKSAEQLHKDALAGDKKARATLERHSSRLARGLAMVCTVFDPDIIVLGGGLSQMPHLYDDLPELVTPHLFARDRAVRIVPPRHGDDSGVRGAAWLWEESRTYTNPHKDWY